MKSSFERIVVVGAGLLGGSFAAALRQKKVEATLVAVDQPPVLEAALERRLVDETYPPERLSEAVFRANLVVLATPIYTILDLLDQLAPMLQPGTLVTDMGSTKREIMCRAGQRLPDAVHFIGGHPMAGAERGGVRNADPFLFENAIYILTEDKPVPGNLVAGLVELVEVVGAKSVFMSAAEHDELASIVSHLPQLLAVTLMNYAAGRNESNPACLKLAAGGFRDMTRISSSPFGIWRDILATNLANVEQALDGFIAALRATREMLQGGKLQRAFDRSAQSRLAIPKDTRGFLRPHFDLYVIVQDKPGVISGIANVLSKHQINIKDIEVVKVREGDAGTIRLAFELEQERREAIVLLEQVGFQTRCRD